MCMYKHAIDDFNNRIKKTHFQLYKFTPFLLILLNQNDTYMSIKKKNYTLYAKFSKYFIKNHIVHSDCHMITRNIYI